MSLTFEDVLSFPEEARVCFSSEPELYQQFIDAISKYANKQYELFTCFISGYGKRWHYTEWIECIA